MTRKRWIKLMRSLGDYDDHDIAEMLDCMKTHGKWCYLEDWKEYMQARNVDFVINKNIVPCYHRKGLYVIETGSFHSWPL